MNCAAVGAANPARACVGDLTAPLAHLSQVMPRRCLGIEDRKWLSRGSLNGHARVAGTGWAIHERIAFP